MNIEGQQITTQLGRRGDENEEKKKMNGKVKDGEEREG